MWEARQVFTDIYILQLGVLRISALRFAKLQNVNCGMLMVPTFQVFPPSLVDIEPVAPKPNPTVLI
jgi:hypothetical protein